MSTEIFEDKSRAKLMELVPQSGASVASKSGGLSRENQNSNQEDASKGYMLDLSDYTGTNNVLSNACIASFLL